MPQSSTGAAVIQLLKMRKVRDTENYACTNQHHTANASVQSWTEVHKLIILIILQIMYLLMFLLLLCVFTLSMDEEFS